MSEDRDQIDYLYAVHCAYDILRMNDASFESDVGNVDRSVMRRQPCRPVSSLDEFCRVGGVEE